MLSNGLYDGAEARASAMRLVAFLTPRDDAVTTESNRASTLAGAEDDAAPNTAAYAKFTASKLSISSDQPLGRTDSRITPSSSFSPLHSRSPPPLPFRVLPRPPPDLLAPVPAVEDLHPAAAGAQGSLR